MGRPCKFEWTEEKIKYLYKYYPERKYDILFEKLNSNNIDMIRHKAMDLGIKVVGYDYTENDILFLKENYDKISYNEISKILNKPIGSISMKINRLGLLKSEKWSDEEINLLIEKYPHYTNKYLSEKIFVSREPNSIRTKALKLGLHKTKEKGVHFFDKDEMIEMLIDLADKLGRTPSLEELSIYGLPSSKSYERYFDGYRQACMMAGLEINESLWGRARIYISSNGDVCYSNSERIITEFFIEKNIKYTKDDKYSSLCDDKRCGNKRVDWVINEEYVVEYWGYPKIEEYKIKKDIKIDICKINNIKLIELERRDLTKLHTIFAMFL
jgi:hypothetical protein